MENQSTSVDTHLWPLAVTSSPAFHRLPLFLLLRMCFPPTSKNVAHQGGEKEKYTRIPDAECFDSTYIL